MQIEAHPHATTQRSLETKEKLEHFKRIRNKSQYILNIFYLQKFLNAFIMLLFTTSLTSYSVASFELMNHLIEWGCFLK